MAWEGLINKEIWAGRIFLIPVREFFRSNNNHKKNRGPP